MAHETLTDATRRLLAERPRNITLEDIAKETGLNYHWLQKFSCGRVPDPTISRLEKLYLYLTNKPLVEAGGE